MLTIGLYALLSVLGLVLLLQQSPLLFQGMTYAGALYLLWLGFHNLMTKPDHVHQAGGAVTAKASLLGAARDGALIALLNPKVGLFFLSLFSQYVHADMSFADKALFVGTITFVDGGWYVLVAAVLARGKVLAWLKRHQLWVERGLGVVLILLALRIFLR